MDGLITEWMKGRQAQLRLSVRIIVACLGSFLAAHVLGFTQGYWAVLTAVIVMQASVGGALKATVDRFVGSFGGAAWGVMVSFLVPHAGFSGLALALTVAVAPLAVLVAFQPAYRVAPITAIILLLTPTSQSAGPLMAAVMRLTEISLGSVVAIAVSLLVLPARAHGMLAEAASRALTLMGELIVVVMSGVSEPIDPVVVQRLHDGIRRAIAQAEAAAAEALQERSRWLTAYPDPEPLCRTLRRTRNDLAIMGRALAKPFDEPVRERLIGPASGVADEVAAFFRESGLALGQQKRPPSLAPVERVLLDYTIAVAELRSSGLARALPDDMVGRVFGLAFTLEQLGQNLGDLVDRIAELAQAD